MSRTSVGFGTRFRAVSFARRPVRAAVAILAAILLSAGAAATRTGPVLTAIADPFASSAVLPVASTHGAGQRLIWCWRHGLLRLRISVSVHVLSWKCLFTRWSVRRAAVAEW